MQNHLGPATCMELQVRLRRHLERNLQSRSGVMYVVKCTIGIPLQPHASPRLLPCRTVDMMMRDTLMTCQQLERASVVFLNR